MIEIKISDDAKIIVNITDKMVEEYAECKRLASIDGGKGKDCSKCSLNASIEDVALCQMPGVTEELGRRIEREQQQVAEIERWKHEAIRQAAAAGEFKIAVGRRLIEVLESIQTVKAQIREEEKSMTLVMALTAKLEVLRREKEWLEGMLQNGVDGL